MCIDDKDSAYNAYTLQRMTPAPADTNVLGTTFNGGPFKFNPVTRTLTMSETIALNHEGSVKFTLCLGTNCGDWYMGYNFCSDCSTFTLTLDTTGITQNYSPSFPTFTLNLDFPDAFSYG